MANSSKPGDVTLQLIAKVTHDEMKNATSPNISHSNIVEVNEDYDVPLILVFECYPPIKAWHWSLPVTASHNNSRSTVYTDSYTTKGTRYAC